MADKIKRLRIQRPLFDQVIAHLQSGYPLEACGILAGQGDKATRLYTIDNRLSSPVAYEMEPRQQLNAMLDLEANDLELLAIFHSHPNGPETPSPTDVAQAYYPESVYLIVSLQHYSNPAARVFSIVNGRVNEIPLIIE